MVVGQILGGRNARRGLGRCVQRPQMRLSHRLEQALKVRALARRSSVIAFSSPDPVLCLPTDGCFRVPQGL